MARRRKKRRSSGNRQTPPRHPITGKFMSKAEIAQLEAEQAQDAPVQVDERPVPGPEVTVESERRVRARPELLRKESSIGTQGTYSPLERNLRRRARRRGIEI